MLYKPVASQDNIRTELTFVVGNGHIIEGDDVANAYLYGDSEVTIYMEPQTDLTGRQQQPGKICRLKKTMYGAS